jgi:hypothetical protein
VNEQLDVVASPAVPDGAVLLVAIAPGGRRTMHELMTAKAATHSPLTDDEERRLDEHASLIAACAARADAMLARRAYAKHKANPTLGALELFVYRAEQVLFHRWVVERFKLSQLDVDRIGHGQAYQQYRFEQNQRHQRPAALQAMKAQLAAGASA